MVSPTARTLRREFIIKALVCCCLAAIELTRGSEEDGSRADGKDIGCTVGKLSDLLQQNGIPHQRHHAEPSRDEERIELLLLLESFGQGKVGQSANPVFDGGFQAMRSTQVVDVDQLESVVVAAGHNSAQGTKEIERFKLVVDERKDAVLRGHFSFSFQNAKSEFLDQHNLFARVEGFDEVFTFLMFSPPVYYFVCILYLVRSNRTLAGESVERVVCSVRGPSSTVRSANLCFASEYSMYVRLKSAVTMQVGCEMY